MTGSFYSFIGCLPYRSLSLAIFSLATALSLPIYADLPNLLPNGDAENEFVNLMIRGQGNSSRIQAKDTGAPNYWRLTEGATLCKDARFSGNHCITLQGRGTSVSATTFADFWRVKDPSMPFGLLLLPNREILVSFYYKTTAALPDGVLSANVTLGMISGLPTQSRKIDLPASTEWKQVETTFMLSEIHWGAEITFALTDQAQGNHQAWLDAVRLTQNIGDPLNLADNGTFERLSPESSWPDAWTEPLEDQWVSWVGAEYRAPFLDSSDAITGNRSVRASVTYADVSGLSQIIRLNQDRPRPVLVGLWSKLDNSVGNRPPGYNGSDNLPNLTVFVYHTDGTMQEVSPTLCLAESDHDWDYRRFGFLPQKPVESIRVQITILGSEPTTSLWLDDIAVCELPDSGASTLPSAVFAPERELTSEWGTLDHPLPDRVTVANDRENLYLAIPKYTTNHDTNVFLNSRIHAGFPNHYRYLYDVIRISEDGSCQKGTVAEKQGYIATGSWIDARDIEVTLEHVQGCQVLTVPFRALNLDGPHDFPIGFNVQWQTPNAPIYWTGNEINADHLGTLIPALPPKVRVASLRFGNRHDLEPDQSQDFVTHPQIYAGQNQADLTLSNPGEAITVQVTAGVQGEEPFQGNITLAPGETKSVTFTYNTGLRTSAEFEISLSVGGSEILRSTYPLVVPPAIEMVLNQEFYFPEEKEATVEVHNRFRPLSKAVRLLFSVEDMTNGKVVYKKAHQITEPTSQFTFPLNELRVNPLPVQDYRVTVTGLGTKGALLCSQSARFGRIEHTQRRPIPPIERVRVDDKGRLIINDDFRFFPIVPSVSVMEWHDAIDLGANMFRAYYGGEFDDLEETNKAWALGAYTLTIGPGPDQVNDFQNAAPKLLSHPGFLSCYAKQFYYWNLDQNLIDYRKRVERIFAEQPSSRLVIWGHHDSSFLYDLGLPTWPIENPPVGYCYVKIMGRPGSGWRNAPFLTQTEQVLDPHKFKLAEVNYYVSYHDDEIVPEHFKTYLSLRADDLRGFRNESYLSIIYGANGLYHYICMQAGGLQRLRGWFQELNYLWPVFVSDDAEHPIRVSPAGSMIETRLKKWEGKYYLLTANAAEAKTSAEIHIEGVKQITVRKLFDLPGEMKISGNRIADTWDKYDAFVYEIEVGGR